MLKRNFTDQSLSRLVSIVLVLLVSISGQPQPDPDPARFQKTIDKFIRWDAKNSAPEQAVLFIGSSSIVGWSTAADFPEFPVINRGFGGSHLSDVIHYYDQVVKNYNPVAVIIYAGDNDVAAGKKADQVHQDYIELNRLIKTDFPGAAIFYLPIKPSISRWDFWPEMVTANSMIKNTINRDPAQYYADTATVLLGENGEPDPGFFIKDGLHLNRSGYDAWNNVLRPYLEKLIR